MGWAQFFEGAHSLYAGERHLAAHAARLAADLAPHLTPPGLTLLDWGCGDAGAADPLARAGTSVLLWDASAAVRARIAARFAGTPGITVLEEAALERLAPACVDRIAVVSVLQYIDERVLDGWLPRWHGWLKPGGALLLADVIPPDATLVDDLKALLIPAARHGYLLAALRALIGSATGPYAVLRRQHGLTRWDPTALATRLTAAGFEASRAPRNIGFDQKRFTLVARKP